MVRVSGCKDYLCFRESVFERERWRWRKREREREREREMVFKKIYGISLLHVEISGA